MGRVNRIQGGLFLFLSGCMKMRIITPGDLWAKLEMNVCMFEAWLLFIGGWLFEIFFQYYCLRIGILLVKFFDFVFMFLETVDRGYDCDKDDRCRDDKGGD